MTAGALRSVRLPRMPPAAYVGVGILALTLVCALVPDLVAPYDPLAFDFTALLQPPSRAHPFGTDQFGRDILSRVIAAAQIDLQIAFFATIGPVVVGSLVGLCVGYFGGVL